MNSAFALVTLLLKGNGKWITKEIYVKKITKFFCSPIQIDLSVDRTYVTSITGVKLDLIDCGVDPETSVLTGNVEITDYPWLGILYYIYDMPSGETRAVTTVALIHELFVIGAAADIGPMPKTNFRRNSRVLLGETWNAEERGIAGYTIHPEYERTQNTIALVQLRDPVRLRRDFKIRPLCPPPEFIRKPEFYVVKFKDDYNQLQKEVIPVLHVPGDLCKEFYIAANLYTKKQRPPHVACVMSVEATDTCVWDAGAALVSRDEWGRWMLLGVGVRGPGCSAPSRFLDMMSYFVWVEAALNKYSTITISQLSKHKFVLRSSEETYRVLQRFGGCDPEEMQPSDLIYRELMKLWTDNNQYQFINYNMTIVQSVEYSCLTLELVNASASSEMRVKHFCPRKVDADGDVEPCHYFRGSTFDISVQMMFSTQCRFEMFAYGKKKIVTLMDVHEHKLEEGTYYEDFSLTSPEYKGTIEQTMTGFEPVDVAMWTPEYDLWKTTVFDPFSTTTEAPPAMNFLNSDESPEEDVFATTRRPKKKIYRPYLPPALMAQLGITGQPTKAEIEAMPGLNLTDYNITLPHESSESSESDFMIGIASKIYIPLRFYNRTQP